MVKIKKNDDNGWTIFMSPELKLMCHNCNKELLNPPFFLCLDTKELFCIDCELKSAKNLCSYITKTSEEHIHYYITNIE